MDKEKKYIQDIKKILLDDTRSILSRVEFVPETKTFRLTFNIFNSKTYVILDNINIKHDVFIDVHYFDNRYYVNKLIETCSNDNIIIKG